MKAGLLLSGGMDSVALAFWKRPAVAYTLDYGQLAAEGEIRAATAVCEEISIMHRVIRADCRHIGSGDMAGTKSSKYAPASDWWPFRNQLLITIAGGAAIADNVTELIIGAVRTDSFHADSRPQFFHKISELMQFQEGGIRIIAPAIGMDAVELARTSKIPRSILAWSHSCHVAPYACGVCRGCTKHAETMKALGYGDY